MRFGRDRFESVQLHQRSACIAPIATIIGPYVAVKTAKS
jgi:hypothetical protein